MDGANPSRLYRLDKCRLPLFSQVGLVDKISRARISSIHVFGDSLAKEVRFNSRQFLMQKVHVDAHEKEFLNMCMGKVNSVLAKPKKGKKS